MSETMQDEHMAAVFLWRYLRAGVAYLFHAAVKINLRHAASVYRHLYRSKTTARGSVVFKVLAL